AWGEPAPSEGRWRDVGFDPRTGPGKVRRGGGQHAVEPAWRRAGGRRGVWLFTSRAGVDPRRGEHGAVVRQPDGVRQSAAGRDRRGPWLRRRSRRAAGGGPR